MNSEAEVRPDFGSAKVAPRESAGLPWSAELSVVSTFALAVQLTLFSFYLFVTRDYAHAVSASAMLNQLGVGMLLLVLPDLINTVWVKRDRNHVSVVALATAGLLIAFAISGHLLGELGTRDHLGPVLTGALVTIAIAGAVLNFIVTFKASAMRGLAVLLLGSAFGLFLSLSFWSDSYHSPFWLERMLGGIAHRDTLFHGAIASLFNTYDYPTIGLDGAARIHYHVGSHFVLGALSNLGGLAVLDVYHYSYPVIFIPLLLKALLVAGMDTADAASQNWCGLLAIPVVIIVFSSFAWPWSMHPAVSESNLLALCLGLLLISIVSRQVGWRGFYLLVGCLVTVLAGLKISVGAPVAACLTYLFVYLGHYRSRTGLSQFAIAAVGFVLATWLLFYPASVPTSVQQASYSAVLDNVFKYSPSIVVLYVALVAVTAYLLIRYRPTSAGAAVRAISSPLGVLWQLNALLAVVTLGCALFTWRNASDASYFLLAYFFLSLPLLLVVVEQVRNLRAPAFALRTLTVTLIGGALSWLLMQEGRAPGYLEQQRSAIESIARLPEEVTGQRLALIEALMGLSTRDAAEKRAAAVFIPESNKLYWGLLRDPAGGMFLAQALSGIAMIGGQVDDIFLQKRHPYPYYDLYQYRRSDYIKAAGQAIESARAGGYRTLIVIEEREKDIIFEEHAL